MQQPSGQRSTVAPINSTPLTENVSRGVPSIVTSSVPKTPSPSQGRTDDPEKSLDTFCQVTVFKILK